MQGWLLIILIALEDWGEGYRGYRFLKINTANMLTMFLDADFCWSNGFLIRCIRVNLRQFFQIPRWAFIFTFLDFEILAI